MISYDCQFFPIIISQFKNTHTKKKYGHSYPNIQFFTSCEYCFKDIHIYICSIYAIVCKIIMPDDSVTRNQCINIVSFINSSRKHILYFSQILSIDASLDVNLVIIRKLLYPLKLFVLYKN